MPAWWETNDYDDGEQPGKQDTPAGWSGPFGPPKRRQPRGACAVVLLLGALIYASGVVTPLLAGGGWRG
jgi:hypothetical protein